MSTGWRLRWRLGVTALAAGILAAQSSAMLGGVTPPVVRLDAEKLPSQHELAQWSTDNGLPSSRVFAVAQTGDGYLWIATAEGLARFEGTRFTVFDGGLAPELANVSVRRLLATRDGGPWLAGRDRALATLPEDGGDGDALLAAADRALYQAKRGGRNRVVTCGPAILQAGLSRAR